jgi:SAM-dependent methyltransferase
MSQAGGFDSYASCYDEALARGVSVSGEDKEYFARGRIAWLAECLQRLSAATSSVLDFGCGTGSATPYFFEQLRAERVVGVDVSAQSVEMARQKNVEYGRATFLRLTDFQPAENIDLVFCNGVFHHIPPAERPAAVRWILQCLRPGGFLAFWENNPWNPGTRLVMSRIPFDRDAITLPPPAARRLLQQNGFEALQMDFQFIFPRALKWLRGLEAPLARWPLGAQYQVLCRRPRV